MRLRISLRSTRRVGPVRLGVTVPLAPARRPRAWAAVGVAKSTGGKR